MAFVVWFAFNTSVKDYLPLFLNVFSYKIDPGLNARITPYLLSRVLYMVFGIALLLTNYPLVKRSPMRKGKGAKHD